jgi:hypothetical protein
MTGASRASILAANFADCGRGVRVMQRYPAPGRFRYKAVLRRLPSAIRDPSRAHHGPTRTPLLT